MARRYGPVGNDDVAVGRASQDDMPGLRKPMRREALLTDDEKPQSDLPGDFSR
jgi:hypothetical protein